MTALTLFDLAQQVRSAVEIIDADTGEITLLDVQARELFDKKALACAAYAKQRRAELEASRAMLKKMDAQLAAQERHAERFEGYIADCMKATGTLEVKHDLGIFGAKLLIDRDESVEIDEGATFPPELCNDPKPPTPSKTKIKAAIKAGEAVAGARIVRKDRLTIT